MWPRKLAEWDQATAPVACMRAFIEPNTYIPAEKFLLAEKEANIHLHRSRRGRNSIGGRQSAKRLSAGQTYQRSSPGEILLEVNWGIGIY